LNEKGPNFCLATGNFRTFFLPFDRHFEINVQILIMVSDKGSAKTDTTWARGGSSFNAYLIQYGVFCAPLNLKVCGQLQSRRNICP
jgi:hypothetical protein